MSELLPIWDQSGALRRLMNKEALLQRVLLMFLDQAEPRLMEIRADINQGRISQAKATTHMLKGSAGEVGAMRLHASLGRLEACLISEPARAADLYNTVAYNYQLFVNEAKHNA